MLTTNQLSGTLEENNLSTYFIIPFESDGSPKVLPNGPVYIISNEDQQIQEKVDMPVLDNTAIDINETSQPAVVNPLPLVHKSDKTLIKPLAEPAETTYSCPKCDNTFKVVKEYKEHLKWHKQQKEFKCTKCSAAYNIENNLKVHTELVHSSGNLTNCPICGVGLTFKRNASLRSHLMVHQVEEVHGCEECDAEFEKEDEYAQHMMTHSIKMKNKTCSLTCSHCDVQFETKHLLKLHISHHAKAWKYFKKKKPKRLTPKEKRYTCGICKKSFIKQSLLGRHERIHSGEKPFQCTICDQSFAQKGTLQIHMVKHTGNKPFACTLCPAKFNQKGNLRVHIKKTHTAPNEGQKMFKCTHCSCIFKRIASLNGHVTKAHLNAKSTQENLVGYVMKNLKDLEELNFDSYVTLTESTSDGTEKKHVVQLKMIGDVKWFRCTYCNKMCKKPSDLIRHIRVHTKEKPFECKICNRAFAVKSLLRSHMNTHIITKNYKCKSCDSAFTTARRLSAHSKKHEKDQWHCITCGTMFEDFNKALQHKMAQDQLHIIQSIVNKVVKQPLYQTVYGNLTFKPPRPKVPNTGVESAVPRPFHCTTCDARFTRKINLKRHIKGHEGDRRYKCNICPKAFITSYRLKEHLNHHNNIKNFTCKICNKKFVTSSYLRRHMITHNNVRPYTCAYCSKTFQMLDLIRRHIKLVHKKDALIEELQKQNVKEPNNDVSNQTTSVIISNVNKPQEVDDNQQPKLETQELLQDPALATQVVNMEGMEMTDLNSGVQTFYVNLEELHNAGISLNSFVDNTDNSENFPIPATDSSLMEVNQTNPILMYTDTCQTLSSINPSTTVSENVFDDNGVYQNSVGINETRTIFDDASIICMNCNQVFSSFVLFQKHACAIATATTTTTTASAMTVSAAQEVADKLEEVENELQRYQEPLQDQQNKIVVEEALLQEEPTLNENNLENIPVTSPATTRFKRKSSFKNNANDMECAKCGKRFTVKNSYLQHLATHRNKSQESSHECMFCTKKFKKASDLVRHHRTHTGEKPYVCEICNKKFSLKSTLKSHVRTHDPNHKQFGCEICDSFYSSKTSLKVHMTIHTGVMPYKCSFCKAEFRTLAAKKTHEVMGHRTVQRKKTKKSNNKKMQDILKTATIEIISDENKLEVQNDVTGIPEYVSFEQFDLVMNQNNLTSQTQTLDLPSQIVNLDIPPENILSTIPEDQGAVDSSNLLQQLQMSDMVLTTNETGAVPSLILDDVSFLDLNTAANNLQIISLPESDGAGVTISIKENLETETKKSKTEKPKLAVECDLCHKMLASKDGLRKHKKNVHSEKSKLSCTKCELTFQTKQRLKIHEKEHLETFFCCSMTFDNEKSLEEHLNSFHPVTDPSKEETSALLNLKLVLQSALMEDSLFNGLFLPKKI